MKRWRVLFKSGHTEVFNAASFQWTDKTFRNAAGEEIGFLNVDEVCYMKLLVQEEVKGA